MMMLKVVLLLGFVAQALKLRCCCWLAAIRSNNMARRWLFCCSTMIFVYVVWMFMVLQHFKFKKIVK
jgi:hypothetical protein